MAKIKTNIVSIIMITLVAIQLAFIAAIIVGERRQRIRDAKSTAIKMSTVAVSGTEDFFQKYLSIFNALKSVEAIIQQETTVSSSLFKRLTQKHSEVVNFAAVKQNGDFFASGKPMLSGNVPNIKHLDFFKRMAAGESVVIMQPHMGPISKVFVTGISVPLKTSDGKFNGEVGVSIKFQALKDRWSGLLSDSGIFMTVHDGNGELYFISPGLKAIDKDRLVGILAVKPDQIQLQGLTFALSESESPLSRWHFSVFVPAHSGILDFASSRKELIGLFVLMIITLIAFAFWFSQERQLILKLKKEQQKLQQSEEQFRQLAENINAVFWVSMPDKNVLLYVSPMFERIWGIDKKELYDNPKLWVEAIHEEDRDRMKAAIEKQAKGKHEETYRIIRRDGGLRWIHGRAFPLLDENENVYRIVGIAEDITSQKQTEEELRRSETKYRSMMESITDQLYICSPESKVEYMNPAMIKRLGRDATGETCHKVLHGLDHKCDWCIFDEVAKGKSLENNIVSPLDGRHYRITNMPVHHKDGTISKMSIYRDITKYKEAVAGKNKAQEQLRQAQKMESIGTLAGGVAHDYNNALTVIMGYTDLAMTDADPKGKLHADLNEILKASKHAKDITRQLLAFARKETIAPMVLDLNTNIEVMLKMLQRLIGEDIDLAWIPGDNLWSVKMDTSQIDQILINLCVNAKDAIAGVGKITIETGMVVLDADYCADHADFIPGDFVMMSISDNGCGIDKEILDNIFEPFFTTKDIDKGTGLGLATVYGIVKQNNGFINVYSEQDRGTTITIYMPRDDSKAVETQREIIKKIPKGRGETILLVEDEISILKLTKKILKGLGYKVLIADTPKGALKLAEEYKSEIHLVVTDVIMPEMYGDELVNSLQSLYPDLKHIFMSGYTAHAIGHHGVLDEGVDFIQKPFSQIDLAKIVRKVLDE